MKTIIAAFLALSALAMVIAGDVDRDDIPEQCTSVCVNLPDVSTECDRLFDADRDETACICASAGAEEAIPLCAACIEHYDDSDNDDDDDDDNSDNDDDDNDVSELLRSCGFSTVTFNPASTYTVRNIIPAATLLKE
ncbi:hypothetical protein LTR84_005863 [Exophiala bonariae]|uniref:Extracellular membrane protein CFEM domain-containing protein n=1 Tax=Exophiala bonariae TaxID=1690606 RepID=A0AAV9N521_9EURO|nr:hypothetical protein LTR84_005863 [Exophiala bonariae]